MCTFTEGTKVKSQATPEDQSHRYKHNLFSPKLSTGSEQRLPEDSVFLVALQVCSILLLPQLPPVQVSGTLNAVHCGSQEDHDTDWHQLGGHPTL